MGMPVTTPRAKIDAEILCTIFTQFPIREASLRSYLVLVATGFFSF
jgi:hypothetical protein